MSRSSAGDYQVDEQAGVAGLSWRVTSRPVVSNSLLPRELYSSRPEYWSGYSLSLLQGIILTQGSNPGLPHCRQILYQLSHKRSAKKLEWVA